MEHARVTVLPQLEMERGFLGYDGEGTYEEATEALQRGREGGHREAASLGQGASLASV